MPGDDLEEAAFAGYQHELLVRRCRAVLLQQCGLIGRAGSIDAEAFVAVLGDDGVGRILRKRWLRQSAHEQCHAGPSSQNLRAQE